jgi:protein-disulfide isomerase
MKKEIKNNKILIISVIAIISIIIIFFIVNNQNDDKQETAKITTKQVNNKNDNIIIDQSNKFLEILKNDHVLGERNAKVRIIEYASMSCPHCAEFYANGFENLQAYIDSGEVSLIYRDFPLNGPALAGAVAAKCYYNKVKQDYKYHNFVKTLFKHQEKWAFTPNFIEKLKEISSIQGISNEELTKCFEDKEMQKNIVTIAKEASTSINIKSTPTFIINGEVVSGYKGWDILSEIIDRKLEDK